MKCDEGAPWYLQSHYTLRLTRGACVKMTFVVVIIIGIIVWGLEEA